MLKIPTIVGDLGWSNAISTALGVYRLYTIFMTMIDLVDRLILIYNEFILTFSCYKLVHEFMA
jgi:hypothetical protein